MSSERDDLHDNQTSSSFNTDGSAASAKSSDDHCNAAASADAAVDSQQQQKIITSSKINRLISTEYIDSDLVPQEDIYIFIKFLGHGSFGKVNLYRNSKDNSLVVWKEINLKYLDHKLRSESFSEVEILSMLNHPNIIAYYKHFISDDTLYIELEYAKGGNLASLIKQQKLAVQKPFDEEIVLWYLYQLANAVDYIHELGIMHRDIKALNIFFMQTGLLKLGDFGIAKILDPNIGLAESQVGTPFYMSPELVEGKKYSNKSDIWSLGCVAYEVMTLEKVFDATNQLKLALKISQCDINLDKLENIPEYNIDMKCLIKRILSKDPDNRPTAREIIQDKIFEHKLTDFDSQIELLSSNKRPRVSNIQNLVGNEFFIPTHTTSTALNSMLNTSNNGNNTNQNNSIITTASRLSEVYIFGGGRFLPMRVDFFKSEHAPLHVSVGPHHFAVITSEKELFTWGAPSSSGNEAGAMLGHGRAAGFSRMPKRVEAFSKGIQIEQVACGEDFTCVCSDDGDLYTFGNNDFGCLGTIEESETESAAVVADSKASSLILNELAYDNLTGRVKYAYVPIKNAFFEANSLKIKRIACGDAHVIVLTHSNQIFTWGCGEYGRLGHGDEDDKHKPTEIKFNFRYIFKNVFAGPDCSFLLTKEGRVLAFGNNDYNKLGLNTNKIGFKMENDQKNLKNSSNIVIQTKPKIVKNLFPYNVSKISAGNDHTAIIDNYGRLYTFGNNKFGQLGVGDFKQRTGVNLVNSLIGHCVSNVACGDSFTVCSTKENHLFSWGNKKDGRLGIDSSLDPSSAASCTPKPIFGSLHMVSEISSSFWNTIIIAEQIINSKPVRSVSYADYMKNTSVAGESNVISLGVGVGAAVDLIAKNVSEIISPRRDPEFMNLANENELIKNKVNQFNQQKNDQAAGSAIPENSGESTDMPEWLKEDLKDAEFIPIEALNQKPALLPSKQMPQRNFQAELTEALELIERLKLENASLSSENFSLKEKLKNLENSININNNI